MKKKKILGIVVGVVIVLGAIGTKDTKQVEQQKASPEMEMYKKFVTLKMGSDYNTGERTPAYRGGSFLLQREQRH